jgi:hypothetical protein
MKNLCWLIAVLVLIVGGSVPEAVASESGIADTTYQAPECLTMKLKKVKRTNKDQPFAETFAIINMELKAQVEKRGPGKGQVFARVDVEVDNRCEETLPLGPQDLKAATGDGSGLWLWLYNEGPEGKFHMSTISFSSDMERGRDRWRLLTELDESETGLSLSFPGGAPLPVTF